MRSVAILITFVHKTTSHGNSSDRYDQDSERKFFK